MFNNAHSLTLNEVAQSMFNANSGRRTQTFLIRAMFWFSEWNKEQYEQRVYAKFDDDVYSLNGNGSYNLFIEDSKAKKNRATN